MNGPVRSGLVVAAHGRRGIVEIDGLRRPFLAKGRTLRVVCGDWVSLEERPGSEALLAVAVQPRTSLLARWRRHDAQEEPLAANLSQVVVVLAPAPAPDPFLVDRHLCAAESMGCRALLAWNKADLAPAPEDRLAEYTKLGYACLAISTRTGRGLDELRAALAGRVSVLLGQSGVGKSSVINALVPGSEAAIGELSAASGTGSHTTTAVLMYRVPGSGGGWLLDTPGVRDFLPALGTRRVDAGFRELAALASACRFADCRHDREPGCAVKAGVEAGTVSARRYQSYLDLAASAAGG